MHCTRKGKGCDLPDRGYVRTGAMLVGMPQQPTQPTVRRSINLPPDIDASLTAYATSHGLTIRDAVILAIKDLTGYPRLGLMQTARRQDAEQ